MVNRILGKANSKNAIIEFSSPIISYRKISLKEAKKEIEHFIKHRKKTWIEDITDGLKIDPRTTLRAIEQLEREGKIRESK